MGTPHHDQSICPSGRCQAMQRGPLHMTLRQRLATLAVARLASYSYRPRCRVPPIAACRQLRCPTVVGSSQASTPSATSAAAALAALGTDRFADPRSRTPAYAVAARLEVDAARLQPGVAQRPISPPDRAAVGLTQSACRTAATPARPVSASTAPASPSLPGRRPASTLARQSSGQIRDAAARTLDTAQAGDLVYYPGHVMMWLGVDNAIVHAVRPRAQRRGRRHCPTVAIKRAKFGNPIG